MKKRLFNTLLILALCLTLLPTVALAEEATTVEVDAAPRLQGVIDDADVDIVKLTNDITLSSTLEVSRTVTLDLNGYMLRAYNSGVSLLIKIKSGGNLTIIDSNPTATYRFTPNIKREYVWTRDESSGTKTVTGGVIYGDGARRGVVVENNGRFTLDGGNIVGCYATDEGAGVRIDNGSENSCGTFIMNGGSISGCVTQDKIERNHYGGGGVYVGTYGSFTMTNGTIRGCRAVSDEQNDGGGVSIFVHGSFTMSGGTIEDCRAGVTRGWGGGVMAYQDATFIMTGGTIQNCTAANSGNAVSGSTNTTFIMTGGTINGIESTTADKYDIDISDYGTVMYAYGGTVNATVKLNYNSYSARSQITVDTTGDYKDYYKPGQFTAFTKAVENLGEVSYGIFYGGLTTGEHGSINGKTITFKNGNDTYAVEVLPEGVVSGAPETPINEDHKFGGWYQKNTDETYTKYTFVSAIDKDIILYANWDCEWGHSGKLVWDKTATQHRRYWNCCEKDVVGTENHEWENGVCKECEYECQHTGGTATCIAQAECTYCGQPYGSTNPDHHSGLGAWEFNENNHWKYCSGCKTNVGTANHSFENGKCECGAVHYTVTFDANGGSVGTEYAETNVSGKLASLPTPSRTGYAFAGWYPDKTGDAKITMDTVFDQNTTVYAHWTAVVYNITYYGLPEGTTEPGNPATYTIESEDITLKAPTWDKHYFLGWTFEGQTEPVSTVTITKGSTGHRAYTANWQERYTVTFDPNGGELAEADSVAYTTVDRVLDLSELPTPSRWGGYRFDGWYTAKNGGEAVTLEMEFTEDTTVYAHWTYYGWIAGVLAGGGARREFDDVSKGDYFYDAVQWAVKEEITDGVDESHFAPNGSCTRAQIVTFLWRAAGCPVACAVNPFGDVRSGDYFYEAVLWAVENGITEGTSATAFSPNAPCTRAQAVAFLLRFAAYQGMDAVTMQELVSGFGDAAKVPGYAISAFNWALGSGIVEGSNGLLMPNDTCTRAQIVTMLYRMLGK